MLSYIIKIFRVFVSKNAFLYFIKNLNLIIGIAISLVLLQVILYEKSYEKSYKNSENIYRLTLEFYNNEIKEVSSCQTFFPVGKQVMDKYPEIVESSRIIKFVGDWIISYKDSIMGNKTFYEDKACLADKSFINQFSLEILSGDTSTLDFKVLLSENAAKKYFGDEDPVGKTIYLTTFMGKWHHEVAGVFKNMPENSHFQFDFMFFMMEPFSYTFGNNWGNNFVYTYIKVNPNTDIQSLENKLTQFHNESRGNTNNNNLIEVKLQPIESIHLNSNLDGELYINSDQKIITLYWIVGIIIFVLSCLIYINLSTSLIVKRTKEVMLKKVMGSDRKLLNFQFIFENFVTLIFSFTIGLLIARALNNYVLSNLLLKVDNSIWSNPYFWIGLSIVIIILVLVSGLLPGTLISGLSVRSANSKTQNGGKVLFLKRSLVFFQYMLSIGLIAGIITIFSQLNFMRNLELGFDKGNLIVLKAVLKRRSENLEFYSMKEELKRMPIFKSVSNSNVIPGEPSNSTSSIKRLDDNSVDYKQMYKIDVDYEYLKTFGIKLVAGRFYQEEFGKEEENIVINETSVKLLGYTSPDQAIDTYITEKSKITKKLKIIGVVQDFRQQYAKHSIQPTIIHIVEKTTGYITVKLDDKVNNKNAITSIKKLWENYYPEVPFTYFTMEDYYSKQYKEDNQFAKLMTILVAIIISLSCIGFLGLSSYQAFQKTKEIGIRRVVGASVPEIISIFLKEQLILIIVASVFSLSLSFYVFSNWLMSFADRINIGIWFIIFPVAIIFFISFITTSFHIFKASLSDPTKALKYE